MKDSIIERIEHIEESILNLQRIVGFLAIVASEAAPEEFKKVFELERESTEA